MFIYIYIYVAYLYINKEEEKKLLAFIFGINPCQSSTIVYLGITFLTIQSCKICKGIGTQIYNLPVL